MEHDSQENVRNHFLGEIETEIVGMQHNARALPGEQINLERESENPHNRRAIRVENGRFDSVGYLPRKMSSWLATLIDDGQIHLDGYVPQVSAEDPNRCPVNLMVFQCEKGRQFLQKAEPKNDLEALHQVIRQAYQDDCKGASKISEKNLVHYSTREEAIQAGKKPCAECQP